MSSVYEELVIEVVTNCNMNAFQASKVVDYLKDVGLIDYDSLKEYYSEEID